MRVLACFLTVWLVVSCSSADKISASALQAAPLLGRGGGDTRTGTMTNEMTDEMTPVMPPDMTPPDETPDMTEDTTPVVPPDMTEDMTPVMPPVVPSQDFAFTTTRGDMYAGRYDGGTGTCVVQGMMVEAENAQDCEMAFEASYGDEVRRYTGPGSFMGTCVTYSGEILTCGVRRCLNFTDPVSNISCRHGRFSVGVAGGSSSPTALHSIFVGRLSLGSSFGDALSDTGLAVLNGDGESLGGLDGFIDRQRDDVSARLSTWLEDAPVRASVAITRGVRAFGVRSASSMQALGMAVGRRQDGLTKMMDEGRFSLPHLQGVAGSRGVMAAGLRYGHGGHGGHEFAMMMGQGDGGEAMAMVAYVNGGFVMRGGVVWEDERVLGTEGNGLFAFAGESATTFASVQRGVELMDGWRAVASMAMGRTRIHTSRKILRASSILRGLDVVSSAFAVRLLGRGVVVAEDMLMVRVGQPLRVEGGDIDLAGRGLDATPSGRTLEFGVGYGVRLTGGLTMRTVFDYVRDGGHVRGGRDELFGLMSLQSRF